MSEHKHRYYLAFTQQSVLWPELGSWWIFHCQYCTSVEKCHSSKFWSLYP